MSLGTVRKGPSDDEYESEFTVSVHFVAKRVNKHGYFLMVHNCSLAHSISAHMVRNCSLARERVEEHRYAVNRGDMKNGVATHAWGSQHKVDWSSAKMRTVEQFQWKRKVLEDIHIQRSQNIQPGLWSSIRSSMDTYYKLQAVSFCITSIYFIYSTHFVSFLPQASPPFCLLPLNFSSLTYTSLF